MNALRAFGAVLLMAAFVGILTFAAVEVAISLITDWRSSVVPVTAGAATAALLWGRRGAGS